MQLSNNTPMQLLVLLLGISGFMIARYIRYHKKNETQPLVCPVGFDCHTVVHSDYSKFLGLPVEFLGMIYYFLMSLAYLVLILNKESPIYFVAFIATFSLIALIFSAYLIVVQIFVLKKYCSWCIVSACICAIIFGLTIYAYDFSAIAQFFLNK